MSLGDRVRTVVIHPRWAIEENAMIFRSCVWFSPFHPPIRVDVSPNVSRRVVFRDWAVKKSSDSGANFCQVVRIRAVVVDVPCSTSGSQKWNGARPSLMARAVVRIVHEILLDICVMSHWPSVQALVMLENRISVEAVACVRKYLVAASIARGWCCLAINGTMAKVLISNPVQARIQWLLEIVSNGPVIKLSVIIMCACGFISIGGILTDIFGVWARKLN